MDDLNYITEDLRGLAVDISEPRLDPKNARTDHDIEGIMEALRDYGQMTPIVINKDEDNRTLKGNGTLKAARLLGWKYIAAVRAKLAPIKGTGYAIADNRLTDNSKFDDYVLAQLVIEMRQAGLNIIGYGREGDQEILDQLVADYSGEPKDLGPDDQDPGDQLPADPAGDLMAKWGTEPGQVWRLGSAADGEHRIICGDSTDPAVRDELLELDRIDLGLTDPPYGINLDLSWMDRVDGRKGKLASTEQIEGDEAGVDITPAFLFDRWIVWGFPYLSNPDMSGWYIWDKWPGVETDKNFGSPVELAFTNCWTGFRLVRVMWAGYYKAAGEEKRYPHPTQKPIGVIKPLIERNTEPGQIIADLFAGSGTTINASERSGRFVRAAELDPRYVAIMLERYCQTFGIEGELL